MKAVGFARYGGPEVLELIDAPDPIRAPDEVLIRVRAIGINPADGKWRSGMFHRFAPLPFPHIGGFDIAGEVIDGDVRLAGTRVIAMVDAFRCGAYAELTVTTPDRLTILPDTVDFNTGAALPTPGLTGVQAIDEQLDVRAGDRVLVTGALGGVGRYCVQAAKERNAIVVAGVRASARAEALALGADEVVMLDGCEYLGPMFDSVVDTIGGAIVAPLCRKVKPTGKIRTAATTPIQADGVPVEIVFFSVHPDSAQLARLVKWAATGQVHVPIATVLPLSEAREGQCRVDAGGVAGKVILIP